MLENMLDGLRNGTVVRLSKRELRVWYDAERLSKNSFRDIFDRLPEGIEIDDISVIQDDDNLYLLKHGEIKLAVEMI